MIHLEDRPRSGVSDVILELIDQAKLRVIMLTGDHESSAWRVANAVGIKEVYCGLKPEDKLNYVKNISRETGENEVISGGPKSAYRVEDLSSYGWCFISGSLESARK